MTEERRLYLSRINSEHRVLVEEADLIREVETIHAEGKADKLKVAAYDAWLVKFNQAPA